MIYISQHQYWYFVCVSYGFFFYLHYHSQWAVNWFNDPRLQRDVPSGVAAFILAIVWSIAWPVSLCYLIAQVSHRIIRWATTKKKKVEDYIRCHACAVRIGLADPHCRFCGADQNDPRTQGSK